MSPVAICSTMAKLLEVDNLVVRYRAMGHVAALLQGVRDPYLDAVLEVSLALGAGRTLGIVGESGSGKSTLGRAIMGLVRPSGGTILFDGRHPTGRSDGALRPWRRQMALMFQDPVASLSPRLTVKSLITEPFRIHGLADRDVDAEAGRLLRMVGLDSGFGARYPHQLSGGQARRVGVARALALSPKLIIADEPTAGLDVSVQGEVLNLMNRLQLQEGLAYIVITHNLPVVRHISDQLAIMYMGRFVEQGATATLFAWPAHPYTEALLTATPVPDPDQRRPRPALRGEVPSLLHRPTGCEFHTRCPYAQERCRLERPLPQLRPPGQTVRCHFPLA
jgi:oligopeptide/dipeptide ABC transporter ATP-binding protein